MSLLSEVGSLCSFGSYRTKRDFILLHLTGGPSGSYAASVLALEGISVAVLEAAKFPR